MATEGEAGTKANAPGHAIDREVVLYNERTGAYEVRGRDGNLKFSLSNQRDIAALASANATFVVSHRPLRLRTGTASCAWPRARIHRKRRR
jgi:hypothetical protein